MLLVGLQDEKRNRPLEMDSRAPSGVCQCEGTIINGFLLWCCSGDIYYSSVLDEMKLDGPDFKADSWSMAVDSAYLQSHSKTVIKRQDVIYGTTVPLISNICNNYCCPPIQKAKINQDV